MPTVKQTMARLEGHEKECLVRYTNIEKQLDAGNKKFDSIDKKLWVLYPLVMAAPIFERLIQ